MLYKGELTVTEPNQLRNIGHFPNLERLFRYMKEAYPIGLEKLEEQDRRLFQNIYHLTSASKFLQAIRDRNFDLARDLAEKYPYAVRA